ncbi:hypothetical protein H1C71_001952, partial [Ictidomys tridecemlineatus]
GQRRLRELAPQQPPARLRPADSQRDRPKDAGTGRRRRHRALPISRLSPAPWSSPRPRLSQTEQNETRKLLAASYTAWVLPASCAGMDGPRNQQKPERGCEGVTGRGIKKL